MRLIKCAAFQVGLVAIWFSTFGQTRPNQFTLSATLTGFDEHTKFYLIDPDSTQRVDSTYLVDAKLIFTGSVTEPTVFRLYPESKDKYFNVWMEDKKIDLVGSRRKFAQLVVKGSPINTIYHEVESKHYALDQLRDSLTLKAVNEPDESKARQIWKRIFPIDSQVKRIRIHTIATFNPSIVTIKELYFLRNDMNNDSLQLLFDRFPAHLKQTKYGNTINQYISTGDLKVGSRYTDIVGKTLNNQEIKLSNYTGKVVLLDFWASWCVPCRASNKQLAALYQTYNQAGFEIVSFSIDTDWERWSKASKEDNLQWTNLSDMKGAYSKQAASYKVRAIPQSYLIDRAGKIAEIFSGYDPAHQDLIKNKIKQLVQQ